MKKLIIILIVFILTLTPILAQADAKNKDERINICFNIDHNYVDFTLITLFSIYKNTKYNDKIDIYIFENNLTNSDKKSIKDYVNKNKSNVYFIDFDTTDFDRGKPLFPYLSHVSSIAMARLKVASELPLNLDKVIYLDSDILVLTDIKELYDTDLEGWYAAMVQDIGGPPYMWYYGLSCYYNSGVMVINLKKWREDNIESKFINFFNDNFEKFINRKRQDFLWFPDQDLLNIILKNKIKSLDKRYNGPYWLSDERTTAGAEDYKIIHYSGPHKPWTFKYTGGIYDIYIDYWNASPWKKKIKTYKKLSGKNNYHFLNIKNTAKTIKINPIK